MNDTICHSCGRPFPETKSRKGLMRRFTALVSFLVSLLYLINPGAGIFEILPDNIPGLGNVDEAGATLLLLWSLEQLGIDPGALFKGKMFGKPKR